MILQPNISSYVPDKSYSIAVVIPAFNVEHHIACVLSTIPSFVTWVIVVNDCSNDKTAGIVSDFRDKRIHLISHIKNQGVGGAVLTAYKKAIELGAEIIVKMDGDGQMDPNYLIPLIAPIVINKADYAKGNRFLHSSQLKSMPLLRRIGNAGLSFMTKVASGYWNIFDPSNGYTAIHSSIIPLLNESKINLRYFFESSMLIQLGMIRAVVQDVEIPAIYQDEKSSLSEWRTLVDFPPRLLAGLAHRLLTQYFVRDFGIFSMLAIAGTIFSIFGTLFGLYHWYLSGKTLTVATTGTVMLAVLPLILGVQLLIQALMVDIQNVPHEPLQTNIKTIETIRKTLRVNFAERHSLPSDLERTLDE